MRGGDSEASAGKRVLCVQTRSPWHPSPSGRGGGVTGGSRRAGQAFSKMTSWLCDQHVCVRKTAFGFLGVSPGAPWWPDVETRLIKGVCLHNNEECFGYDRFVSSTLAVK